VVINGIHLDHKSDAFEQLDFLWSFVVYWKLALVGCFYDT
jgi:hypothetical protein